MLKSGVVLFLYLMTVSFTKQYNSPEDINLRNLYGRTDTWKEQVHLKVTAFILHYKRN